MGFEDPRKNRPTIAASSPPPSPGKTGIIHVRLHNVRASSFQNWKISSSILVERIEFEKLNRNPAPNNITCRSYRSGENLVCKKKKKRKGKRKKKEKNKITREQRDESSFALNYRLLEKPHALLLHVIFHPVDDYDNTRILGSQRVTREL